MELYSIFFIDANTGIPVHTYNEQRVHSDNSQILFSGIMVTIQKLMEDIEAGQLKTIKTEQYKLIGETGKRFVLFAIGVFDVEYIISDFLKQLIGFLDSQNIQTLTTGLEDNIVQLLDTMINQFVDVWKKRETTISLLQYKERLGFQFLFNTNNASFDNFLIGYLSSLQDAIIYKPHTFMISSPSNTQVFGIILCKESHSFVLTISFSTLSISDVMANHHSYVSLALQFVDENFKLLVDKNTQKNQLVNLYAKFNNTLEENINRYQFEVDFLRVKSILPKLKKHIPALLSSILLGKPIAVYCEKKSTAKPIIDTLIYISGITNASLDLNPDFPHRITWCEKEYLNLHNSLGYVIYDLNNSLVINAKTESYFDKIWKSIQQSQSDYNQLLLEIRNICFNLWNLCKSILNDYVEGIEFQDSLKKHTFIKEETQFVSKMLNWINPHLQKKIRDPLDIKGVNW